MRVRWKLNEGEEGKGEGMEVWCVDICGWRHIAECFPDPRLYNVQTMIVRAKV